MVFTVYALYSKSYDKHYYGYTTDINARFLSHNELGSDWTCRYRPWTIIFTKEFSTKSEAMAYEKWLKTGRGREFIKGLPH